MTYFYDIKDANYDEIPEYNAFFYDFNSQKLVTMNIFSESSVKEIIEDLQRKLGKDNRIFYFDDLKEIILKWAQYHYWCRREYELFIGDAFEEDIDKYEKVDIFTQVKMNIDLITRDFLEKIFSIKATPEIPTKEKEAEAVATFDCADKIQKAIDKATEELRTENIKLKYSEIPRLEGYIEGLKYFIDDSGGE